MKWHKKPSAWYLGICSLLSLIYFRHGNIDILDSVLFFLCIDASLSRLDRLLLRICETSHLFMSILELCDAVLGYVTLFLSYITRCFIAAFEHVYERSERKDARQILHLILTHYRPLLLFYISLNHQKT